MWQNTCGERSPPKFKEIVYNSYERVVILHRKKAAMQKNIKNTKNAMMRAACDAR